MFCACAWNAGSGPKPTAHPRCYMFVTRCNPGADPRSRRGSMPVEDAGSQRVTQRAWSRVVGALTLALLVAVVGAASLADAQGTDPAPGSTIGVANTDGTTLNLRASPSTTGDVVATLASGALLTVTGPARAVSEGR